MDTREDTPKVAEILSDVAFPAEKWQITTCADVYGADVGLRRKLYSLPARSYESPADVTSTME